MIFGPAVMIEFPFQARANRIWLGVGRVRKIIPSNTLMRFRKLRIAWSVAWGVVAVLLIVLWVRSYWMV